MAMKPTDNLKGFAYQRPPLIIFLVCLLLFAIALISLGVYIQNHKVRNYEDKDWNEFLQDFSQQQFCIPLDYNLTADSAVLNVLASTTQETETEIGFDINDFVSSKNVSFAIMLELPPIENQKLQNLAGLLTLISSVPAKQIKLDKECDCKDIDMTFHLAHPIEDCATEQCESSKLTACVTLAVSQGALPLISSNAHPQACNKSTVHSFSNAPVMSPKLKQSTDDFCSDGILVNTAYLYNPKLTFYLSQEEKSIINLHLMYTSYFLFIMLITCVFYALVKGSPIKTSRVLHENGNHKKPLSPI